jgi:hypothetical protein
MSILRAAASIVLSGEDLAAGEREARLTRLSEAFADDPREREQVREELQDYPSPAVDGDSLLAGITDVEDKEEVAKLCREAIADRCGERPPTGT